MTQEEVLKRVITAFEDSAIPYMLVGAIAVNYYGRPRLTHDIDIIVEIGRAQAARIVKLFEDEFYVSLDGILEAIQHGTMFNLIHQHTGLKIDCWMLKEDEFDRSRFPRRQKCIVFDREMSISSPEDLILVKLQWYKDSGSEKHLLDARGILEVQAEALDKQYLSNWASRLSLKDLLERIT